VPDVSAVREVFRRNAFCVIATASQAGQPWLSPVFFNYTPRFDLVWESAAAALHSQYLRANPRIAVFLKDPSAKAPARDVYIEATAREVAPEGVAAALDTWQNGPHGHSNRAERRPADYREGKPLRLYEARIDRLYVLDETVVEGYRVDVRVEVDMAALRAAGT
jgi:nitroimidazol reductase NimA-like FMN-containing flavoprotein (pyridoxamine 5'-phosphate oxidase superfamily)